MISSAPPKSGVRKFLGSAPSSPAEKRRAAHSRCVLSAQQTGIHRHDCRLAPAGPRPFPWRGRVTAGYEPTDCWPGQGPCRARAARRLRERLRHLDGLCRRTICPRIMHGGTMTTTLPQRTGTVPSSVNVAAQF